MILSCCLSAGGFLFLRITPHRRNVTPAVSITAPPPPLDFIRLFKAGAAGSHSPDQMALHGPRCNVLIFLTITVLNYRCLLRKCHYGGYHVGKKRGFPSSFLNGYFFSNESWGRFLRQLIKGPASSSVGPGQGPHPPHITTLSGLAGGTGEDLGGRGACTRTQGQN